MVEVFQKTVSDERTYAKLLMEIILDLYDSLDIRTNKNKDNKDDVRSEDSFVSAVSNQDNPSLYISIDSIITAETEVSSESHKTLIIFRCLHLTQVMLENIEKNLQNNFEFIEILHNLIIPSVRSHNAAIREKGLRCLGLYCLLDKKLAKENLALFCHCLVKGHDSLQIEAIKIITDIFMCYKYDVFDDSSTDLHSIQLLYEQILQNTSNSDIMATTVEAVAKLMLISFFDDPKLLKTLIILYFHPETSSNSHLRQILAYFIPAYSYSLPKNQFSLQKIFVPTLHDLSQIFENFDDTESISFSQIALQMMDWIDPKKLVNSHLSNNLSSSYTKTNENIYLSLANDICTQISASYNKEKRTLSSLLNKLHITHASDQQLALSIHSTINSILMKNNLDSFTKNSLIKFSTTLHKFILSN